VNPKSAKAKGRRLQNWVRDKLIEWYGDHHAKNIVPKQMGGGGVDIEVYGTFRDMYWPWDAECKNQERLPLWQTIKQAVANCRPGRAPLVIFKRNHSKVWVMLEWDDFIRLSHSFDTVKHFRETQETQTEQE